MRQEHVLVDATEERCVLVGVVTSDINETLATEYIDELEFLALTAGAISERKFLQKLQVPHPKTYVGSGKLEEIRDYMVSEEIDVIIFDDELNP
ncbi:MAG: GTPase HflX, partial [Crocinitomicaceae bacterium]|nr:GTPase HflX [Crocinitomicaceae bacterium]